MSNGFPEIPDDLFDQFNWSGFDTDVRDEQVEFLSTVDDAKLHLLGLRVQGYQEVEARNKRILTLVHYYLGLGFRLLPVVS